MSYLGVASSEHAAEVVATATAAASAAAVTAAVAAVAATPAPTGYLLAADAALLYQRKTASANWSDFVPVSGATVTLTVPADGSPANACINNAALLATLTLVLPIDGVTDGQVIRISARSAVTALNMNAATGGFVQGAMTSLVAGGGGTYQFRASNKTWYRF